MRSRLDMMELPRLLRRLQSAWADLEAACAGLSEMEMMEPGVQGNWSVRDIIAHVSTWEEEALTHLPHILEGGRPPRYSTTYGGIDGFNALMTERKRGLTLADVVRQRDEIHERLVDYIGNAPKEALKPESRFRRRLRLDTYGHYPKHARAIRDWRERVRSA